ncbi:MAG: response regulator [Clostridiales bacterium]|nr:response regulator [Clostridiales bacterium]
MDSPRSKIVLVDDNKATLTLGRNLLKTFYEVYPASSAEKLFDLLENITPDLILLDVEMPDVNGFEAIKRLKADPRYVGTPVIFLTSKSDDYSEMEGFDLGAVDYITKPFSNPLLLKRIESQLLIVKQRNDLLASQAILQDYAENLEIKVKEKTAEVITLQNTVLATVADLVEFRDKLTGGHITRTQRYLQALLDELHRTGTYLDQIAKWDVDFFLTSAQLHDVGKIAITDLILNKPAKLTTEEFEVMKTHVSAGVDAIEHIIQQTEESDFLDHALLIAGTHHEKWDGSGYPVGLKGRNIPIEGRLMALADVYDALISKRPYKEAYTHEEACRIIEEGAGSHFDPDLVQAFRNVKDQFAQIAREIVDGRA